MSGCSRFYSEIRIDEVPSSLISTVVSILLEVLVEQCVSGIPDNDIRQISDLYRYNKKSMRKEI